jgi:hypothetical protein
MIPFSPDSAPANKVANHLEPARADLRGDHDENNPSRVLGSTTVPSAPPTLSWKDWFEELSHAHLTFLVILPISGCIASWFYPPRPGTFIFMISYGYLTALGRSDFAVFWKKMKFKNYHLNRYHCGLSSPLVAPIVQRIEGSTVFPCCMWCRCTSRVDQMVGQSTSSPPQVHRHRP